MLTHNNPATLAGAAFIAQVVVDILQGSDPAAAMEAGAGTGGGRILIWISASAVRLTPKPRRVAG